MTEFRNLLQQEFLKRSGKNPGYSLRAFAKALGINHATLSGLMSGKRPVSPATMQKLSKTLQLPPEKVGEFVESRKGKSYFILQQDAFNAMSEWYFDAILELTLIPNFKLEADIIADSIGITRTQAQIALETLERLDLLMKDSSGRWKLRYQDSTNILDPDFTSVANKKYQQSVLEKSIQSIETVDRKNRDHTSTTMAINSRDLPKVKKLIQKFRHDLNSYLQRPQSTPDSVYQLQVSFFPLTKNNFKRSNS